MRHLQSPIKSEDKSVKEDEETVSLRRSLKLQQTKFMTRQRIFEEKMKKQKEIDNLMKIKLSKHTELIKLWDSGRGTKKITFDDNGLAIELKPKLEFKSFLPQATF